MAIHNSAGWAIKSMKPHFILAGAHLVTFLVLVVHPFPPVKLSMENDARRQQSSPQSGMATGGAHAPVRDALSRPITAGGFVDGAPLVFVDFTKQAGVDKFRHRSGT